jgi:hypothetical protein
VQWFLNHLAVHCSHVSPLTSAHYTAALDDACERFKAQTSDALKTHSGHVANDAMLAFAFYAQYGGTLEDEKQDDGNDGTRGQSIRFPVTNLPHDWDMWASSGALHLTPSHDGKTVRLSWPHPFMVEFLLSNAEVVSAADHHQLRSFLAACVAQPDTMPGVAFQFACAYEVASDDSPLLRRIIALFDNYTLKPKPCLPPVHLFTLFEDLPSVLNHVFMVADKYSDGKSRYVDIVRAVVRNGDSQVSIRIEAKRKKKSADLRAEAVAFFQKCEEAPGDHLNLFLSYYEMEMPSRQSKNIKYLNAITKNPHFRILSGPTWFEDCAFPFDSLGPPQSPADVRAFQQKMFACPPMKLYFD